jgi:hypothetical protein
MLVITPFLYKSRDLLQSGLSLSKVDKEKLMNKFKAVFLSLIFVLLFLSDNIALADTGPKPTMDFAFKGLQEGELQIISGILYECEQSDCSDARPLEALGPQGLYCDTMSCRATAYGFAPYHILEVEFSDEVTRRSNIFETAGFQSSYTVTIQPNDLLVEAQFSLKAFSSVNLFLIACVCAIIIGVGIVVLAVFLVRRSRTK